VIFGFNTDVKFADTVYHVQSEARQHELRLETQVFVKGRCIGKYSSSYAERMQEPDFSEDHMHQMLKDQHRHLVAAVREGRISAELGEHVEPVQAEPLPLAAAAHADASDEPTAIIEAFVSEPAVPEFPVVGYPELPAAHASAAAPILEPEALPPTPIVEPEPSPPTTAAAPIVEPEPLPPAHAETVVTPAGEVVAEAAPGKTPDSGFTLKPAGKLIGKGLSLECLPPAPTSDGAAIIISVEIADESGPASGAQVSCRITSGKARAQYVYATAGESGVADVHLVLTDLDLTATAVLIQASHRGKSASRKYKLQPST
jgi:hypothetical protein